MGIQMLTRFHCISLKTCCADNKIFFLCSTPRAKIFAMIKAVHLALVTYSRRNSLEKI